MNPESLQNFSLFLDPQVLSAFVVGVFSVLTTFFTWLVNRGRRSETRNLRIDQLHNFYEPMDYPLNFKPVDSPVQTLSDAACLVAEQYRYTTPDIQLELRRLLKADNLTDNDLEELRSMVSSVYNWLRRSLGYPYDKKLINYDYLPKSIGTFYSLLDYIAWIAYVISLVLGLAAIGFVCALVPIRIYKTIAIVLGICVLSYILYLFVWMFLQMFKKK